MYSLPYQFNIVLRILTRILRQLKEIKELQIGKEEAKVLLLSVDIIIYISDTKIFTRKLLMLIKILSKAAGYKLTKKNQ